MCNRPAVSASTRSLPRAAARCTASKMIELGSPPSAPRTRSAPARSAHVAELLGCGGPEGVAGGHHDRSTFVGLAPADLADRRRLADAVDADEQPHVGGAGVEAQGAVTRAEVGLHLLLQRLEELDGVGDAALGDGRSQPVEQLGGGGEPDIRPDQGLLEVVPRLLVDLPAGEDRPEVARHRAPGPTQPITERRLRRLDDRLGLGLRLWLRLGERLDRDGGRFGASTVGAGGGARRADGRRFEGGPPALAGGRRRRCHLRGRRRAGR